MVHRGRRNQPSGEPSGLAIGVFSAFMLAVVVGCFWWLGQYSADVQARSQYLLETELQFEEGSAYPAKIIGIDKVQEGMNGDFFLVSGSISGLDEVYVLIVSVNIGGVDRIVQVALPDVEFVQVEGMKDATMAIDLYDWQSIEVYDDDTLADVFERYFDGAVIELSPEEYERLIQDML